MNATRKLTLITFGAGLPNWRAAARRLGRQADDSGVFDKVIIYTDRDLPRLFPEFSDQHRSILKLSYPGFGYWIWKPYLIWHTLSEEVSKAGQGLLYLDAGFELNVHTPAARHRLDSYFDLAASNGGVAGMHLPGHPEYLWTKSTVMSAFGLNSSQQEADQVQATPVLVRTKEATDFARTWYEMCIQGDYWMVRDDVSPSEGCHRAIAHRHDQSVFSCLIKQRRIKTIPDETFWAPDWEGSGYDFPLWAARNRTRVSLRDKSRRARMVRFTEKAYSRVIHRAYQRWHRHS